VFTIFVGNILGRKKTIVSSTKSLELEVQELTSCSLLVRLS
jgi:hypothetical protein